MVNIILTSGITYGAIKHSFGINDGRHLTRDHWQKVSQKFNIHIKELLIKIVTKISFAVIYYHEFLGEIFDW